MTLKTVLKNFLNHADTLEAQKKLGNDLYELDFQKLKALTEELKRDKDYSSSEGLKEVNRRKNRYKDILPYDYTRVILSEYPGVPGSDFINANYIKGASGSLAYIASQGPLPNTVVDFWRMIWECEIQVIVMACNEQESGKYKCECYWPVDEEKKQYGNINVEFVKWRQVCPDFLVRTLKACWENEERVICQFHYTTWPDHGVPNSVQPILELVRLIRDCQASEAVPVLIHCSAGCGRTGTICAIDYVWGLMRMGKLTKNFNLFNVIADMRRQRIAMVQTKEQYVLVYKAVSSLFEQQLRVIDSHTYENLDEDGEPLILKELHPEEDIYEDILDPPFEDSFLHDDKDEKNLTLQKTYPETSFGKKDPKKDVCYDYYSHLKKSSKNEARIETAPNEVKTDEKLSHTKDPDSDSDLHYTKNSRTLQKLCREESVKRLISGWNKAVELSEDPLIVVKESQPDNRSHKSPTVKKYHESQKVSQVHSTDVHSQKGDTDVTKSIKGLKSSSQYQESHKTSSPEDAHAGKLVGKATVIRRPSIAKLKALFEKSSPGSVEPSDPNRQRRTLFRSHSHYVSHSSRAFTVSDAGDYGTHSHEASNREENVSRRDIAHQKAYYDRHRTVTSSAENGKVDFVQDNKRSSDKPSVADSHVEEIKYTTNIPNESVTSHSMVDEEVSQGSRTPHKKSSSRKEKVPDLPLKKKLPPPPQTDHTVKESLTDGLVPRFQVSTSKGNQTYSDSHKHFNPTDIELNRIKNQAESSLKNAMGVKSMDGQSEEGQKEYRRHSQEIEKHVLFKNQSFSDPEQGSSRNTDMNKQAIKPKSSLNDQTYPKLSYSGGKTASDNKISVNYESAYMNVNSLAQKNIRQIEDKLKNHPRGAIIDLTSRKSYIDETTNTEKNYVFRNTSQPVKFIQPQEARDLVPREKLNATNKSENVSTSSSAKSNSAAPNSNADGKTENSKADSDPLNSKNLLLHSPPPKSKRGHHTSKTTSKSPISPPPVTEGSSRNSKGTPNDPSGHTKQSTSKTPPPPANFSLVSSPPNLNVATSTTTTAVDRSDPRYFPVNRQTASDAKYESEKHKAIARERAAASAIAQGGNIYESLYSVKSSMPIYLKLPMPYEKSKTDEKVHSKIYTKDSKYSQENPSKSPLEKEPIYGLQRSTSGPQMLPPVAVDGSQKANYSSDSNKSSQADPCQPSPHYEQNASYSQSSGNQQSSFPPGPPKPPRTYHYDISSNPDRMPTSESYKVDQSVNRDGGRYIVTVASPKHSNVYNVLPPRSGPEYRYADGSHPPSHVQYAYVPQPTNEVHMSRSYPLTNYDNLYSHPRPYGKQFYPESVVYRNVQPITHVGSALYGTVKEKPHYPQHTIYGTVKARNTYADYENVYDAQGDYVHAAHIKNEHSSHLPNADKAMPNLQYSKSDANVYGVLQPHRNHLVKGSQGDYQSIDDAAAAVPKRVYFDTLQRKHKHHVSWEQSRSRDDMDIRSAPSARLREQIHARRSMVELDNLEISVASDDGYPEKNMTERSMSSPEPVNKLPGQKHERYTEGPHSTESQKKSGAHCKEPTSFGETLSKAFGRLTSLTKFSGKEAATSSSGVNENSTNGLKASKLKEKEKQHNFSLQSPASSKEPVSEQWTQV